MTYIVVETVGDEAAAAVLIEALVAHDIPAQRRRVPGSPYGPARLEIEVRVPAAQLAAARAVLAQVAEDAEAAALREARLVEPLEPPTGPQRRRPRRRWTLLTSEREHTLLLLGAAFVAALLFVRVLQTMCCPR
jgi:hypothetical protein